MRGVEKHSRRRCVLAWDDEAGNLLAATRTFHDGDSDSVWVCLAFGFSATTTSLPHIHYPTWQPLSTMLGRSRSECDSSTSQLGGYFPNGKVLCASHYFVWSRKNSRLVSCGWVRNVFLRRKRSPKGSYIPSDEGTLPKSGYNSRESSCGRVYPMLFWTRQGESGRRPISWARLTLSKQYVPSLMEWCPDQKSLKP